MYAPPFVLRLAKATQYEDYFQEPAKALGTTPASTSMSPINRPNHTIVTRMQKTYIVLMQTLWLSV